VCGTDPGERVEEVPDRFPDLRVGIKGDLAGELPPLVPAMVDEQLISAGDR
jgi:hypothetical protein